MKKDYFFGLSEEGFHKVAYLEWGQPSDNWPPIVCVHGMTRLAQDFDDLAAYLAGTGHHLYCPDIVGRGESDWLKNPLHYTYEQYAADMNVLIGRTYAKQVDWIGTSMGGLIGMILAAANNSPIRKLILNDIGAEIPVKGISRLSKFAVKDPDFPSLEAAKNYFKTVYSGFGPLTEAQWDRIAKTSVREIEPGKFVSKVDYGVKIALTKSKFAWSSLLHPYKALEGVFFDVDLWPIWRKIKCPVLVIRGQNSDILLASTVQKMREIHPGTDIIEIPNVGHAPALLDESQHKLINDWLNQN